eukprot:NODE_217_length_12479_cov_0.651212.p6 type:complete len:281 gc:universal NODE_217_length_12479_cov_0.651212:3888-4730(+)
MNVEAHRSKCLQDDDEEVILSTSAVTQYISECYLLVLRSLIVVLQTQIIGYIELQLVARKNGWRPRLGDLNLCNFNPYFYIHRLQTSELLDLRLELVNIETTVGNLIVLIGAFIWNTYRFYKYKYLQKSKIIQTLSYMTDEDQIQQICKQMYILSLNSSCNDQLKVLSTQLFKDLNTIQLRDKKDEAKELHDICISELNRSFPEYFESLIDVPESIESPLTDIELDFTIEYKDKETQKVNHTAFMYSMLQNQNIFAELTNDLLKSTNANINPPVNCIKPT